MAQAPNGASKIIAQRYGLSAPLGLGTVSLRRRARGRQRPGQTRSVFSWPGPMELAQEQECEQAEVGAAAIHRDGVTVDACRRQVMAKPGDGCMGNIAPGRTRHETRPDVQIQRSAEYCFNRIGTIMSDQKRVVQRL